MASNTSDSGLHIVLLGTCDSKLQELLYLREQVLAQGGSQTKITLIDVGRSPVHHTDITIPQQDLIARYGKDVPKDLQSLPRKEVIDHMTTCASACVKDLFSQGNIHGIVSAGGSGGTSLTSAVMRDALPIGFPKLIVSTVASGETGHIVGETDIALMYSVVDVAGLNTLLRGVLSNAAGAIAGMANAYKRRKEAESDSSAGEKKRIGVTMFGVTTPGVDAIRAHLESNYPVEVFVFHATGHGGRAMERLVNEGQLDAVLDLTTTEVCDFLSGGNMSAGPARLEAAAKAGIPNVVSLGATDMVNFGPRGTVPEKYRGRQLYEHNPSVTLMRTSKEECHAVGAFIAKKLTESAVMPELVEVWAPKGGVSMLSKDGEAFEDREADEMVHKVLRKDLEGTGINFVEDERDVNDPGFAVDIAERLIEKLWLYDHKKQS